MRKIIGTVFLIFFLFLLLGAGLSGDLNVFENTMTENIMYSGILGTFLVVAVICFDKK